MLEINDIKCFKNYLVAYEDNGDCLFYHYNFTVFWRNTMDFILVDSDFLLFRIAG